MLRQYRHIILYAFSLAALLVLLQFLEYKLVIISHAFELYVTLIAVFFTCLGIWLAMKLSKPKVKTQIKTVVIEKEVAPLKQEALFIRNEEKIQELGLSNRELEVLQAMATGLSNNEIAAQLYISLNTVKTHSARLFEKLDVKRRTQAIDKARQLGLIA